MMYVVVLVKMTFATITPLFSNLHLNNACVICSQSPVADVIRLSILNANVNRTLNCVRLVKVAMKS